MPYLKRYSLNTVRHVIRMGLFPWNVSVSVLLNTKDSSIKLRSNDLQINNQNCGLKVLASLWFQRDASFKNDYYDSVPVQNKYYKERQLPLIGLLQVYNVFTYCFVVKSMPFSIPWLEGYGWSISMISKKRNISFKTKSTAIGQYWLRWFHNEVHIQACAHQIVGWKNEWDSLWSWFVTVNISFFSSSLFSKLGFNVVFPFKL